MNIPLSSIAKPKIGTCPHGLPAGACPICNGSGGGGGGGSSAPKTRPAGEMSWNECYAMGQMMKAQKLAQQQRDVAMHAQLHAPVTIENKLNTMAQKIAGFSEKLTQFIQKAQATPTIMSKTLALAAKIALPVLNVLKAVTTMAQNTLNFVKEKLADISDKLNAVFGELKASIEKKISDKFKDFKKKVKSLFTIFEPVEQKEETEKAEEDKRIFEFKKAFESIKNHLTKKNLKELEDGSSYN